MGVKSLKPGIKLTIENPSSGESSAFGPGIAALCTGVRETGSLNAAAKSMGMAYSKAWRIMKETEASLGIQLLIRDGAHGSTLTKDCNTLLDAYTALEAEMEESALRSYKKLIS